MSKKLNLVLDIETNGPVIGRHSMIQFGISCVEDPSIFFYAELSPISPDWDPGALNAIGLTHEQSCSYPPAYQAMDNFHKWIQGFDKRPVMWSDNPGFDWGWLNWYMWTYVGSNPLGWSCRRIGDLDAGLRCDLYNQKWKNTRVTAHTHNALDDARGNAEALAILLSRAQSGN